MWHISLTQRYRHLWVGSRRFAVFEACVIGVVSGLAAVLLKSGIGWLGSWRVHLSHQFPAWIALPLIGILGGLLAGWLIERLAPEAAGSGIPQVKAALANVPIALNLRVALVKMVSVMVSLGAGLNLGRQGPTVQVGAALAAQLSQWLPTSPEYRRQLIAAGAAAGLAAGFNAPIAGVLFVVEEFLQDFSGLTLGTAILASFVGAVVSRLLGGQGLSLNPELTESAVNFSLQDVPFFLILGLLAGSLGALFSQGVFASLAVYRQLRLSLPLKIGLAGLVSGVALIALPEAFRDNTGLQEFVSTGGATWLFTLLAFGVKFVLTLVAYGAGTPGGLFAPALLLGASLGHLIGSLAQALEVWVGLPMGLPMGISDPSTYALAGMGAFFSAVTRGPITAIVIVFEITTDFNLVLPLMIGSVIAYLIADRVATGSIYTRLLAWNGIHLEKPTTASGVWGNLTAANLMQRRVETLSSSMTLDEAVQAFSRSHHRGFPVVDEGKLVGIVTQTDLADSSRRPAKTEAITLADIMTPKPVTVHPADPLTHVLFLLNRFNLSRLPVTEDHKLVGIITRADIIRAEADQVNPRASQFGPQPEPSYVVYQTRSPATGTGRLLVPLSNPETASTLIRLAAAIANDRNYELECLQVICIPRGQSPAETLVRTTKSRRLLKQAEKLCLSLQVPVHTQIRIAHDPAHAILETLSERHIDLVLMGWKGTTSTPGRIFGNVVDTLIRQAACEVILVKLQEKPTFRHWLVPIAGGPNAQEALRLLPSLVLLGYRPDIKICQVFDHPPTPSETEKLKATAMNLEAEVACSVEAHPTWGDSVPERVLSLASQTRSDVIMLGASREGLLQQVIKGNIPEEISRSSACSVILVRGAITAKSSS